MCTCRWESFWESSWWRLPGRGSRFCCSGCVCPVMSLRHQCGHAGACFWQLRELEEQGPYFLRELGTSISPGLSPRPSEAGAGQTRPSIGVPILTHRASQKTPPKPDPSLPIGWEELGLSTLPTQPLVSQETWLSASVPSRTTSSPPCSAPWLPVPGSAFSDMQNL